MSYQLKNDDVFSTLVFEEINNEQSDGQSVSQSYHVFAKTLTTHKASVRYDCIVSGWIDGA